MSSNSDFDVLEIDDADETASVFAHQRYGYFEVYGFKAEADSKVVNRVFARRPGGGRITPDRDGIYWKQVESDPDVWAGGQAVRQRPGLLASGSARRQAPGSALAQCRSDSWHGGCTKGEDPCRASPNRTHRAPAKGSP